MMYDEEVDICFSRFLKRNQARVYCGAHFRYRSVVLDLKPVQSAWKSQVSPIAWF